MIAVVPLRLKFEMTADVIAVSEDGATCNVHPWPAVITEAVEKAMRESQIEAIAKIAGQDVKLIVMPCQP